MKTRYKVLFSFLFSLTFCATLKAETIIEMETEKTIIDIEKEAIEAKDGVILKYGDISIRSDFLKKIEGKNILFSYGNVIFTQGNQIIKANEVVFDMDTKQAKIIDSESYDTNLKLRFGGNETYSEYPNKVIIKDGWFTTSPYEKPNYKIDAKELEIYPNRKIVAKNIGVNVKGKTYLKLPYYVASLKPVTQRATLFPYIGSDSDRGLFGILGFDYDRGPLAQGFVDFEVSRKKRLALKFSNDYAFAPNNKGNLFVNRVVFPMGNVESEWDFSWKHQVINTPKKDKIDRRFYNLGYGIWNLNYKNITTNLMNAVDGVELKDDYSDYVAKYKKIGFFDFKIDQEIGQNGELNFDYYWTSDKEALKELTEINDYIVDRDDLDPRKTDVDLYRRIKYTNGNSDVLINIENEDFLDINPGYIGDINSYRKTQNYSIDFKGPKIKFEFLDSDKDEYNEVFNIRKRDDGNVEFDFEKNDRWLQTVAYDRKKEVGFTLGNYYPFQRNEFFGYRPKTLTEYLTNNLYFGAIGKNVDIQKKIYEYDYTRDNDNYNTFFLTSGTRNDSRAYKIYEDSEKIKRAKKIIYEQYTLGKLNIGNDRIDLPFKDSYIGFNYGIEERDYSSVYIPEFNKGRKIEDTSSKTGYKIAKDANGNELKQSPTALIQTLDTKLYTTVFDNTHKINNKYDVKITNESDLIIQNSDVNNATYNGYDIIETPTDALGLKNDFKLYLGNMTFNYDFIGREDKHFSDNWLKNRYVRNYFKADIDNKRFLSFDFEKNDEYEFENYKNEENKKREVQYGYTSNTNDNFLYKYTDRNVKYYPYNESYGWNRSEYKELAREKTFSMNFNEWGIEYSNVKNKINDIYDTNGTTPLGTPELKLNTNYHNIGFVYDTKKMKNKKIESDHYVRVTLGTGKKEYRNTNGTPLISSDDIYVYGKDYTSIGLLYRYENNGKTKYVDETIVTPRIVSNNIIENKEIVNESNTQDFSIENLNRKNALNNVQINSEDSLFLTTEEEKVYNSYVDEEINKPNKFNLNDFNSRLQDLRKGKKYFQIGVNLELDGSSNIDNTNINGLGRVNDFAFKVEGGYLEKFFASYKFKMERPDRIYRNKPNQYSKYNFRKHDFEMKYSFGKDPDRPWWVGTKLQYVQDGAPKSSDPEIYKSSYIATKVNKLTLALATLSHRFENVEWEIGAGMKWDKPDDKKLGYYPVVTLKFGITPFPDKNVQVGYTEGSLKFGAGF